jgi:hypothetical protein
MAVNYKFIDQKVGLSSGGALPLNATLWAAATVYAVGAVVQNGGFLFRCSVAGTSAAAGVTAGPSPTVLADNTVTWVLMIALSSLCQSDLTAQHDLGYQAIAKDDTYGMATFKYVKFTGACVPGDFVIIDQQGSTGVVTPAAAPGANKISIIGISMGTQANGTFGWVMIQGVHDQANVTAALTVGTVLSGGAVAGRANQAVANYIFEAAVLRNAGVAGKGVVEIYWPTCSGR